MRHARDNSHCYAGQRGFTLLELLIASIIFSIMAVMAYGGLENVIDNSESSNRQLQRLQQLQQCISVLNRDFSQLTQRGIRDEYGNVQPYLSTAQDIDLMVEFTRGGHVNPANLKRSSLQRIAYRFEDGKLSRLLWPQLDRAQSMEPAETTLIEELEEVTLRFLDPQGEWHEQWPPLSIEPGVTIKPAAIEIVMQLKDWGDIRRLYAMD